MLFNTIFGLEPLLLFKEKVSLTPPPFFNSFSGSVSITGIRLMKTFKNIYPLIRYPLYDTCTKVGNLKVDIDRDYLKPCDQIVKV